MNKLLPFIFFGLFGVSQAHAACPQVVCHRGNANNPYLINIQMVDPVETNGRCDGYLDVGDNVDELFVVKSVTRSNGGKTYSGPLIELSVTRKTFSEGQGKGVLTWRWSKNGKVRTKANLSCTTTF